MKELEEKIAALQAELDAAKAENETLKEQNNALNKASDIWYKQRCQMEERLKAIATVVNSFIL